MLRQKLSLQERINALHEEIQRLVAARVDEIAKEPPGVPKGSIEQMTFGRAGGCRCRMAKLLPQNLAG